MVGTCPWRKRQQGDKEAVMGCQMNGKHVENDIEGSIGVEVEVTYKADDFLPYEPSSSCYNWTRLDWTSGRG